MAESYDGSISLAVKTKTDVKSVEKSVSGIKSSMTSALSRVSSSLKKLPDSFNGVTKRSKELTAAMNQMNLDKATKQAKFDKIALQIEKATVDAKKLQSEISKLETQKMINPEYESVLKRCVQLVGEIEKQEIKLGGMTEGTKKYEIEAEKLKDLQYELKGTREYERELVRDGQKFIIPDNSQKIEALKVRLAQTNQRAEQLRLSLQKTNKSVNMKKPQTNMQRFANTTKKTCKVLDTLRNKAQSAGNAVNSSFKSGLKNILKWGFGIKTTFILFKKIKQAIKDSLGTMSQSVPQVQNDLNSLKASLANVKNALGTAFQPILTAVTPVINSLCNLLVKAINIIGEFTAALTGQKFIYKAATQSANSYAGAVGKVAKAKEKLYKSGLDTINNYDDKTKDDGAGGGAGASATPKVEYSKQEVSQQVQEWVQKFKDAWKDADFTEIGKTVGNKVAKALKKIDWNKIQKTAKKIGKSVATFINGAVESELPETLGETIGEGVNTGLEAGSGFVNNLHWDSLGRSVAKIANKTVKTIKWGQAGKLISDSFKGVLTTASGFIEQMDWASLGDAVVTLIKNIDWLGIIAGLLTVQADIKLGIMSLMSGVTGGLIDWIADIFDALGLHAIAGFLRGVADKLRSGVASIRQWFTDYILTPFKQLFGLGDGEGESITFKQFGKNIITGLVNGIKGLWSMITSTVSDLYNAITTDFINIAPWFSEKFGKVVAAIKNAFTSGKIGDFFSGVWNGIKNVFGNVADWFRDKFSTAWQKVKDVFSKGGQVFSGIKDGILAQFKNIVNKLIDGINRVVAIPFRGLNTALGKLKNVSIMGAQPFSGIISTIDIPSIPHLAKGGVIPPNKEFLAVLGDQKQGTNIEAPLETIKEGLRQVMGETSQNSGGNYEFIAQINRRTLFDEFISEAKMRKLQTGTNVLLNI